MNSYCRKTLNMEIVSFQSKCSVITLLYSQLLSLNFKCALEIAALIFVIYGSHFWKKNKEWWCRIFHFGVRVFVASSLKYDWVSCIYFVSRNLAKLIRWSRDVFSVDSPGCSAAGFLPFHRACFSCPSPTLQPCPGPAALRRVRTAAGDTFALSLSSRGKRSVCHKESALSHGACVFIESWLRSWFSGGFIRNRCRILSHAFSHINRYDRVISLLWPVICSGWYWLILNIAFQEFLGYGT